MDQALIECVPNISEGQDGALIRQISDRVQSVEGVTLLGVDPGFATNRTVITMVGAPDAVCEAAFRVVQQAAELIDMRPQQGEHPRFGATDVCPLVPLANITMEETVVYARNLARRIGDELGISVFCYEHAALVEERKNLAVCRQGEYEGLGERLADSKWKPDFGPTTLNARAGATAVGAREFLVAYNVNLNTTSVRWANAIAFDVREKGRKTDEGDWVPGTLKSVKAFGWFIEEYGIAQVSMNLTDVNSTPIHVVFEEVCKKAEERGVRVTGSELVGLIPLKALCDAGRFYLDRQQQSTEVSDAELIEISVKTLGLGELAPFNSDEKIIQYAVAKEQKVATERLVDKSVAAYVAETASDASVVPAGGSSAAVAEDDGGGTESSCASDR